MIKNSKKKGIITMVSIMFILLGILTPSLTTSANKLDEANQKLDEDLNGLVDGVEEPEEEGEDKFEGVLEKILDDLTENPNPEKNTLTHVLKRSLAPGEYLNDVSQGVIARDIGVSKKEIAPDGMLCNPKAPNNLINHNCNIPNFTTGLIQSIYSVGYSPFRGATKTSAHATFGLGVPNDIPGGEVPINPNNRSHTYTALELFGYDLKLTGYNGEWDNITVSSQARMLSNFGVIDNISLIGTSMWNSVSGAIGSAISNFEINPMRWASIIGKAFEAAASSGINTVIDTQDLNIVATNAWKREQINKSLYNVYVMTDKEVLNEISSIYFQIYLEVFSSLAESNPTLQKVLELKEIPGFTYEEDMETEESIKAREKVSNHNSNEDSKVAADPDYVASYKDAPEPVFYTEKEQLGFWAKENEGALSEASGEGLISGDPDDYESYDELVSQWNASWQIYFSREFDAGGSTIQEMFEKADLDVLSKNPHLDPKQGISHYACANENGTIMRNESGGIEYLYLENNKGSKESVNPKCGKVRKPINAGLLGSGWETKRAADTRHSLEVNSFDIPIPASGFFSSTARSLNSFISKVTNVIIGFSFSPILSELGIDTVISELMLSFRDTIFFPMSSLAAAIGAIMLFVQVMKSGSAIQFFSTLFVTALVFISGAAFLLSPAATIAVVEEIPTKIDNFIAQAVLSDDDGTQYCSTGSEDDAIRSAQCNVWGAMVFDPWVMLQFGTSYDNLYAKGHAPANGSEMKNENEDLVGDAEVNMGNGKKVHNWALYQLSLTKSGTITTRGKLNIQKLGTVDKNMYRLVDLQAGPNNGAGTDKRFFEAWSGVNTPNPFLSITTTIQTVLMSLALISIGFMKIEASLMFSISLLFFPFMLLYALFPKGQMKLKAYFSNLVSLLITRVIAVLMFAILLKIYSLAYSITGSLGQSSILSIVVSVTFIMYRKEIIRLVSATEAGIFKGSGDLSTMAKEKMPKALRQQINITKSKITGGLAGGAGGAIATVQGSASEYLGRRDLNSKLDSLEKRETALAENGEELSRDELELREEYKIRISAYDDYKDGKRSLKDNVTDGAVSGSTLVGKRAQREMRREGFAIEKIYKDSKDQVYTDGADSITNKDEPGVLDTYNEVLSQSKSNRGKTSTSQLTKEDGRLLRDPKIQRKIRKISDENKKVMKLDNPHETKDGEAYMTTNKEELNKIAKGIKNKSIEAKDNMIGKKKQEKKVNLPDDEIRKAILTDKDELEKVAEFLDKKRMAKKVKGHISSPSAEKVIQKEARIRNVFEKESSRFEDSLIENISGINDNRNKNKVNDEEEKEGDNDKKEE